MKRINKLMFIFAIISVLFITVSYSAFNTNLYVSGSGVLRAQVDIRVVGIRNTGYHGNAIENYNPNYNVDITNMSVDLPSSSDYVTYKVTIKNYGNEVYLPQIDIQSEISSNVQVTISDTTTTYNLPNNNMNYKLNTNEEKEYTIKISNKPNTTNEDIVVSLKYHFVIDEVTSPIIALDSNEENIEIVTPGTSTFSVDHYEYYVSETNIEPSSSSTATGTTTGTISKSSINYGHFYVWYRTVSTKGTVSSWSNSIEVQNLYTLTYNSNGGSSCSPLTASPNTAWGTLCASTKESYRLAGWFTDNNAFANEVTAASIATSNLTVYAKWVPKTLYSVLENEYNNNTGFAKLYSGSHQDSMDISKSTETIYYWYGSSAANGTTILSKNNVVFANQCWQMIRTTDTGGVRLMYNGEPTITEVDGKTQYDCSTSRPGHIGSIRTTQSLSGSYYYGDGYTTSVSGNTTTYTLTNATQVTINTSNASTEIPLIAQNQPYTCRSTSATGTCTTLYKVDSQSSGVTANVYASTYRDAIGTSAFNSNYNSVVDVGYMYNSRYAVSNTSMSKSVTMLGSVTLSSSNLTTYGNYYFGDSYSLSGNNHVLSNAVKGNTITDYPTSWVGMYQCNSSSSSSCTTAYYIAAIDTSGTNPIIYRATLASGKTETDSTYKYLFGDGFKDNGDGTFSLTGTIEEVAQKDWNTKYSSMTNKFVCLPGYYTYDSNTGENTCYDTRVTNKVDAIGYVTATTITNFSYRPVYKYGFGIESSGSNYKLAANGSEEGTLQYIYNWSSTSNSSCFTNSNSISDCGYKTLSKSHYTCFNLSGECSTYYYINYTSNSGAYSAPITGGKYVSTDLTDKNNILYLALYQNDENGKVNNTNSTIKGNIDTWYQNTLLTDYDKYIDDTIYCNNRTITNFGGWNPNGGTTDSNYSLYFKENSIPTDVAQVDLSCPNTTDKFSKSNEAARLTYKVGLMSVPELNLLHQANARTSSYYYWLASPSYFSSNAYGHDVSTNGGWYSYIVNYAYGVRPAVSLVSGMEYLSGGDGSMTNPYIVDLDSINN